MLDLETFGLKPNCVIRSVGAVQFDPHTGKLGDEFYANVEEKSCTKLKMTKDQSTVDWWNKPDKAEAQKQLLIDVIPLPDVNERFCSFFKNTKAEFVWSQGSNFDGVLYAHALSLTGHACPWKFYNAFDTRTAYWMSGFNTFTMKRSGTYHNALDDAKHQVVCVHRSMLKLKGKMV